MRIVDLLERNALLYAGKPAVAVVGGEKVSYAELRARVLRWASLLRHLGVERGDRVTLLAANGLAYFDVYLACAYLGAAAVPLGTRLTTAELGGIVADAEPAVGISDADHADTLAAALPSGTPQLVHGAAETDALLARHGGSPPSDEAAGEDVALLIYTSGTTGAPKGVCLSQRALCFNGLTLGLAQEFVHGDVFLTTTPLYHAATGTRIVTMLLDGQTNVVLPRFDADELPGIIDGYGVTSTILVPTQLARMLDAPSLRDASFDTFRLLVYGAAPSGLELIRRAIVELPCGLFQGYGSSEACSGLTALGPPDHHPQATDERLRSCGRPLTGVELRVCAEDSIEPLGAGEVGEVHVRSEKVMSGYWRRPEETARAFTSDGWLRMGDLGHQDADGYLTLVGRVSDMIISGGVNVYPSEIERVVAKLPGVDEAAVVGAPHPEWGEVPVAFVVAGPEGADPEQVREHCRAELASYKVPRRVVIVDELPRTAANGKVRKAELRQLAAAG